MRPARGPDDADVIRARLRALLDEGSGGGWVPDDPPSAAAPGPGGDLHRAPQPEADDVDPGPGEPLPATGGRHRSPVPAVRLDPGRPGARALWVAATVAVLVLLVLTWRDRPTAAPVEPATSSELPPTAGGAAGTGATAAPATVVVSVVGRVGRPGLVTLPEGARVADALEAAGGLLPGVDAAGVNLAALLTDGQQVAVGVPGAGAPAAPGQGPEAAAGAAGAAVNINTAAVGELDALPGVGPVLAQRIVEHRERNGPFGAVADLQDVTGIGPAILDGLADAAAV